MILRSFSNCLWCFLRAESFFWRWTLRRSSWRCVALRRRSWRRCRAYTRGWSPTLGTGWRISSRSSRTRFLRNRKRRSGWSRTCYNLITETSLGLRCVCASKPSEFAARVECALAPQACEQEVTLSKATACWGVVLSAVRKKNTHGQGTVPCDAPEVHIISSANVLSFLSIILLLSIKQCPSHHPPVMLNIVLPTAFCFTFILADLCITVNWIRCYYCCNMQYVRLIFIGT